MSEKIAGVYVIFGTCNRIYVGESADILFRKSLYVPRSLGCDWTIVRYMPNSTGSERSKMERRIMAAYRKAGYTLVSKHKGETGGVKKGTEAYDRRWSPERRKRHGDLMRARTQTPGWQKAHSERMKRYNAGRTPEQRRVYGLRAWETRRANEAKRNQPE